MVLLERGGIPVKAVAIGLDDEALLGPIEVDPLALDEDVHLGHLQTLFSAEDQEVNLRCGDSVGESRVGLRSNALQALGALSAAAMLGDDLPQPRPAEATASIGLDKIMLQLPRVQACGGVEESSLDSRDWYASFDGDVLVGKRSGLV